MRRSSGLGLRPRPLLVAPETVPAQPRHVAWFRPPPFAPELCVVFNRVPPSALAPHALRCTQQLLGRHLPSPVAVPGRPTSAPDAVPKQDVALLKGTPLLGWGGRGVGG